MSTAFPVPDEFEAEMGTVNVPLADGLPEIAPLLLFKLSPLRRLPDIAEEKRWGNSFRGNIMQERRTSDSGRARGA